MPLIEFVAAPLVTLHWNDDGTAFLRVAADVKPLEIGACAQIGAVVAHQRALLPRCADWTRVLIEAIVLCHVYCDVTFVAAVRVGAPPGTTPTRLE